MRTIQEQSGAENGKQRGVRTKQEQGPKASLAYRNMSPAGLCSLDRAGSVAARGTGAQRPRAAPRRMLQAGAAVQIRRVHVG